MIRWSSTTSSAANEEWYLYDASGNRVMRRSASTTSTGNPATAAATITVYAFGLEEHVYSYSGSGSTLTTTSNTYYYSLGGRLLGSYNGINTSFYLTDLLGSVVSTISNTASSASVLGNQLYGPYGNQRYAKGSIGTAKGFTGQYSDQLTGLDYYNARYYDPVAGRFTSADTVQGNAQGADPYAYVRGNPETKNDPTGHFSLSDLAGEARGSRQPDPTTATPDPSIGSTRHSTSPPAISLSLPPKPQSNGGHAGSATATRTPVAKQKQTQQKQKAVKPDYSKAVEAMREAESNFEAASAWANTLSWVFSLAGAVVATGALGSSETVIGGLTLGTIALNLEELAGAMGYSKRKLIHLQGNFQLRRAILKSGFLIKPT
jgi:RHS repeat-associated protein